MKPIILWDLDGTLTDPKIGILTCIQYALRATQLPVPEMNELLWCIGPPLHESFRKLSPEASEEDITKLIAKYRERFADKGMFENEICPGIPEMMESLTHKKHFVATAKPHHFAVPILEHFGLAKFFQKIYGSELDGTRSNKGDLILYILDQEKIAPGETLIVGDREHDIRGAKKAGIQSVGITWGYGSREELQSAGADYIFDQPAQLGAFLQK